MSDERRGGGRLDEGTLKKGGVNREYQIPERPPDPPPMKPPTPNNPAPKQD
jgi:hypothetical protein